MPKLLNHNFFCEIFNNKLIWQINKEEKDKKEDDLTIVIW